MRERSFSARSETGNVTRSAMLAASQTRPLNVRFPPNDYPNPGPNNSQQGCNAGASGCPNFLGRYNALQRPKCASGRKSAEVAGVYCQAKAIAGDPGAHRNDKGTASLCERAAHPGRRFGGAFVRDTSVG